MKNLLSGFLAMGLISVGVMVGCDRPIEQPTAPGASTYPTITFTVTSSPMVTSTGIVTPTPTATRTATVMATSSVTGTSTFSPTATVSSTSTPSFTATNMSAFTGTFTATQTSTSTNGGGNTDTPTVTATSTPTNLGGMTSTSTMSPTPTSTNLGGDTNTPTVTPTSTSTNLGGMTSTPTVTATNQAAQAMVNLGSAANYAVLAYSQITNSGPSTLCGSLGIFPLSQVDGGISITCGGVTDVADGPASQAKMDLSTAYTDASTRPGGASLPAGGDLGGQTLYPGLYNCGGDLLLSSGNLTLAAPDSSNTVFIFQVTGDLIIGPSRQVFLTGNATAANVFWAVAGYCSLDTSVSFVGSIMAYTSVTLNTGAVLQGRALAENGNVTLLTNNITVPGL